YSPGIRKALGEGERRAGQAGHLGGRLSWSAVGGAGGTCQRSHAARRTRGSACARGAGTGHRERHNTGLGISRAARAHFLAPDGASAAYGSGVCGWRPAEPSARYTYRSPGCRTVSTSFAQWLVATARVCRSPDRCRQSLRDAQRGRTSRPGAGEQPGIIARSACWSGSEARALHVLVHRTGQTGNALGFSGILPTIGLTGAVATT